MLTPQPNQAPFDRLKHYRSVLAPEAIPGRIDILITHTAPLVLREEGEGCGALGAVLGELDKQPRFHLFNGSPQGNMIYGGCLERSGSGSGLASRSRLVDGRKCMEFGEQNMGTLTTCVCVCVCVCVWTCGRVHVCVWGVRVCMGACVSPQLMPSLRTALRQSGCVTP